MTSPPPDSGAEGQDVAGNTGRPPIMLMVGGAAVGVAVTWIFALIGLPSPELFGALIAGIVIAWRRTSPPSIPRPLRVMAQGVIGVIIGASATLPALRRFASDWPSVTAVTLVTLVISIGSGLALARWRGLDRPTGVFSMIAGGAATLTAIAQELHADARVVSVLQYLRVIIVLITLPAVVGLAFRPDSTGRSLAAPNTELATDLAFVAVSLFAGLALARLIPISTLTILGPMAVAGTLSIGGWWGPVAVPDFAASASYVVIGLTVGLEFTREALAHIRRVLPAALALTVALIVACGALAAVLAAVTDIDLLTAYLATTPGGLFAVLAIAVDAGAIATYVFAVQLVRLITILLIAPLLARWLRPAAGTT